MKKVVVFLIVVSFWSCRTSVLIPHNQDPVDFIIEDYYATNEAYVNTYNYFEVDKAENDKCVDLYRISPSLNNYYMPTVKYNLFDIYPTSYKVIEGKTFLWRNSQDTIPSMEVMTFLESKV